MNFSGDHDVIVIGAGAGGMTAACVAAAEGLATLLIEKADRVGGTTSVSGGMVWVPANAKMRAAGNTDSLEQARLYVSAPRVHPAFPQGVALASVGAAHRARRGAPCSRSPLVRPRRASRAGQRAGGAPAPIGRDARRAAAHVDTGRVA